MFTEDDHSRMHVALEEARCAAKQGEIPIGAVLIHRPSGTIAAKAGNRTIGLCDPTAHAEILTIREICKKTGAQRIPDYDLYVTIEPCPMCASAISFARVGTVIFGASDPKSGGITPPLRLYDHPQIHHKPAVRQGLLVDDCAKLMKDFFAERRK